jgi:hypothetical protein
MSWGCSSPPRAPARPSYVPDHDSQISLTYQEFLDAVERMRSVDFPIERDEPPPDAWSDFVGWRLITSKPPTRWLANSRRCRRSGQAPQDRRVPSPPPSSSNT